MIAIVFPHVYCNDGIITDLSGYGFIPENLGLEEKLNTKLDKSALVSEIGYSNEKVMDQRIVTNELAKRL
ncbi:hypothetical protein, partial [Morganella morganii]|uniref:hypothetical protein n=1 Tax=Morganella morganii TaxID=582 RepID=UPI003333772F